MSHKQILMSVDGLFQHLWSCCWTKLRWQQKYEHYSSGAKYSVMAIVTLALPTW